MLRSILALNLLLAAATVGLSPAAGASPCDEGSDCPEPPCEHSICDGWDCDGSALDCVPGCDDPTLESLCTNAEPLCVWYDNFYVCVETPCSGLVVVAVLGACSEGCDADVAVVAAFDSCTGRCFSDRLIVAVHDSCRYCISEGVLVALEESCYEWCSSNALLVAVDDSCLQGCSAYTAIVAVDDSCGGEGCRAQAVVAILNSCNITDLVVACVVYDGGWVCAWVPAYFTPAPGDAVRPVG